MAENLRVIKFLALAVHFQGALYTTIEFIAAANTPRTAIAI